MMVKKSESRAFKGQALNGASGVVAWGVKQAGGLVYEAMFQERTARRLARLTDEFPQADWTRHEAVLVAEGFDLSDPADL